MQKVLERRFDAREFDIDTEAGWVKFALQDPAEIDFVAMAEIMLDASYVLHAVVVELEGRKDGGEFVVQGSNQRLAVQGYVPAGDVVKVRGSVDWRVENAPLVVQ